MKKNFIVEKKNTNKWDKKDEIEIKYKVVMKEDVPDGEPADKLTLESSEPINIQKKDEVVIQQITFQKKLGKK